MNGHEPAAARAREDAPNHSHRVFFWAKPFENS